MTGDERRCTCPKTPAPKAPEPEPIDWRPVVDGPPGERRIASGIGERPPWKSYRWTAEVLGVRLFKSKKRVAWVGPEYIQTVTPKKGQSLDDAARHLATEVKRKLEAECLAEAWGSWR